MNDIDKMQIISDLPLKNKSRASFGFSHYSEVITDLIMSSFPRFTMGIFGPWGSGKTTLLQLIYQELITKFQNGEKVIPVWFNAWRYEREATLIVPLLYTMRDELLAHTQQRQETRSDPQQLEVVEAFKKLGNSFGPLAKAVAAGTRISISAPGGVLKFDYEAGKTFEFADKLREEYGSDSIYYDTFKYLAEFLDKQDTKTRVVIFVDDLDRCFASKAVEMLEAIKLFLDLPGFIFVMGMSYNVIVQAVDSKYEAKSAISGTDYIKKIIQVPFHLPAIRQSDVEEYMFGIEFDELGISLPPDTLQRVVQVVASRVQANPRDIKRLLNNFIMTKRISGADTDPEILISLLVIQFRWLLLYQRISERPTAFQDLSHQILDTLNNVPESIREISIDKLRKIDADNDKLFQVASLLRDFEGSAQVFSQEAWGFLLGNPGREVLSIQNLEDYLFFADATEFIAPTDIRFANMASFTGEFTQGFPKFEWHIWVDEKRQILRQIEQVVYHLSSGDFVAYSPQDQFQYKSSGWREFGIEIDVFFKNGVQLSTLHKLELTKFISDRTTGL